MAKLYLTDNRVFNVVPEDGKKFQLEEMQQMIKGYIEMINLPSGKVFIGDEDGRDVLPLNRRASVEWQKEFPIEKYPDNNLPTVFGDVLITEPEFLKD